MADTGLVTIRGFKAGAIKYTALRGFVPSPSASTLVACLVSRGFGTANTHRRALRGFVTTVTTAGAYAIFGGSIVTSTAEDGWL